MAVVRLGREQLRQLLHAHRISFSANPDLEDLHDPEYDAKLYRIEELLSNRLDRCFAFYQFCR